MVIEIINGIILYGLPITLITEHALQHNLDRNVENLAFKYRIKV